MFAVDDPSDTLVVLAAEDAFDAEPGLERIQAPTLVLGGAADSFYSEELFAERPAASPTDGP